ncbi:DUF4303 domain-containing protein [Listeria costaricensis]|uniref:DUF4303 domain-containing protein n=1 Tax=Listeria costaricensis TaxID=2026604 RepID=UPI000C0702AB|nr:DUF4303 domain-containing protein [Listeria costaricensis]
MMQLTENDIKKFWKNTEESRKDFMSKPPSNELIQCIEATVGWTLPKAYIEIMRIQNGGLLKKRFFQCKDRTGHIQKTVQCEGLLSIGNDRPFSIMEFYESEKNEWVRSIFTQGVVIGITFTSIGMDYFSLNYVNKGKNNKPQVVFHTREWRSQEWQPVDYVLAESFEEFFTGLVNKPMKIPFDNERFQSALYKEVKQAYAAHSEQAGTEELTAFGLYMDDRCSMISSAGNTAAYLEAARAEDPENRAVYQYLSTEWQFEGCPDTDLFSALDRMLQDYHGMLLNEQGLKKFRNDLLDQCVEVLARLKKENFFPENLLLMVNISNDDLPKARFERIKKQLNGAHLLD